MRALSRRSCRGFTLIELVTVLLILGIMSVYVAPKFTGFNSFSDNGFQSQVIGALQFARKAADAQRRNVKVSLAANSLTITVDTLNDDTAGAGSYAALALPAPQNQNGCASNQVCAPSSGILTLTGPSSLVFSPIGQANASSYLYTVADAGTGFSANVTVDPISGYVY
jgi:MSHA pilin protein MshC